MLSGPGSCKNAIFSYGQCNQMLERGLTKTVNRKTPVEGRFPPISATNCPDLHFCDRRQFPVHPGDIPQEVSGARPCAPPHECGSLREVMRRVRLLHTVRWRRWRRRRRPRPRGGERLDPDTKDPARPGGPAAAARAPLPSSRRRVQKCTFHLGLLHTPANLPGYKNVRFSYGTCTPPPEPARKSKRSQFTSGRGPVSLDSRLFQLWNGPERGGGTKMYASPNSCTPQ